MYNGKILVKMTFSKQNYNVFNTLTNIKRVPVHLNNPNVVIQNMKIMLDTIKEGREMLREIQKERFVPIQILLSKNIKTFVH